VKLFAGRLDPVLPSGADVVEEALHEWASLRRETRGEDPVRVIDCDCGHTLQAANDDDLVRVARQHVDQDHPDMDLSDDDLRALVADKAYTATDS
jgi:predicted small metal-binding protein